MRHDRARPRPARRPRRHRGRARRVRRARGPAAAGRAEQGRRARRPRARRDGHAPTCEARGLHGLPGLRRHPRGPARAVLRDGRARRRGARRGAGRRGDPDRAAARRPSTTPDFTVVADRRAAGGVRGEKPERWVRQTDFTNDEAVGFLADRLNRLGVEEAAGRAPAPSRRRGGHRRGRRRRGLRLRADARRPAPSCCTGRRGTRPAPRRALSRRARRAGAARRAGSWSRSARRR